VLAAQDAAHRAAERAGELAALRLALVPKAVLADLRLDLVFQKGAPSHSLWMRQSMRHPRGSALGFNPGQYFELLFLLIEPVLPAARVFGSFDEAFAF